MGLEGQEAALEFTLLVTEFTHLEHTMERVLSLIMKSDEMTAAHVMRSIVSANARIQLMRNLLERARHNSDKTSEYDEIIEEYSKINTNRNEFVHARWYTNIQSGKIFIIKRSDDKLIVDIAAKKEFDVKEFKSVRTRILNLTNKIYKLLAIEAENVELKG